MDRRPDPTDELYEFAREAYACADYEQAVYFLRKASALAPMRQDIRQFLAEVLSGSKTGAQPSEPSPIRVASVASPEPVFVARFRDADSVSPEFTPASAPPSAFQQSLRRFIHRLPVAAFFGGAPSPADPDSSSAQEFQPMARIEPVPVSSATFSAFPVRVRPNAHTDQNAQDLPSESVTGDYDVMSLPDPMQSPDYPSDEEAPSFSEPRSMAPESVDPPVWTSPIITESPKTIHRSDSRDTGEEAPRPRELRSASRGTVRRPASAEGEEQSALETASEWVASLPSVPRRTIAFSAAYASVALFMGVASVQCFDKFVRPESKIAAPVPVETVSSGASSPTSISAPDTNSTELRTVAAATVLPNHPPSGSDALLKARTALKKGRLDESAELLKSLPTLNAPEARSVIADLAQAYDRQGTELLRQSQFTEAIASYSKACGYSSADAAFALHLGNAYYYFARRTSTDAERTRYAGKAVEKLQRSLEIDSRNVETHHRLATVYALLDRYPDARKHWTQGMDLLKQSLKAQGDKVEIHERIATIAVCLGRKAEARAAYEAILKLAKPGSEAIADARFGLKALDDKK